MQTAGTRQAITVRRDDLACALAASGVPAERADPVWARLVADDAGGTDSARRLGGANVPVHLGALVTMLGLTYFGATAWDSYGAGAMVVLTVIYALGFAGAGRALIARGWSTPGGLSITAAVVMAPLAVYAFEVATGLWPGDDPGGFGGFHEVVRGG